MNATSEHRYATASGVELAIFVMLTHDGDSSACVVEVRPDAKDGYQPLAILTVRWKPKAGELRLVETCATYAPPADRLIPKASVDLTVKHLVNALSWALSQEPPEDWANWCTTSIASVLALQL